MLKRPSGIEQLRPITLNIRIGNAIVPLISDHPYRKPYERTICSVAGKNRRDPLDSILVLEVAFSY
jgi:hypothetical protein